MMEPDQMQVCAMNAKPTLAQLSAWSHVIGYSLSELSLSRLRESRGTTASLDHPASSIQHPASRVRSASRERGTPPRGSKVVGGLYDELTQLLVLMEEAPLARSLGALPRGKNHTRMSVAVRSIA